MATTWMKALHRSGGTAAALDRTAEYIMDAEKTNGGELIGSYKCDPVTAQSEFLFSKRLYEQKTGRDQGSRDVIAYHIRMSFKPGEVTAEQVLELGRELALRWTKGNHQFIVAAHNNTGNPHAHIVFNSVNLDCDGKFSDFKRSAIALRRVSDLICLEHGLSVIEKPGLSKGYNRAEYLGGKEALSVRDRLRGLMDAALSGCKDFNTFLAAMKDAGCEVKLGKHLAFKIAGGKRFIRCDSLGDDYVERAFLERISGKRIIAPAGAPAKPNLLIEIQEKMRQGYGEGFRQGASVRNLKDAAKTLIYLRENGLDNYDALTKAAENAARRFDDLSDRARANDKRMKEINELQKQIGAYIRTKDVYVQYVRSGRDGGFYEANRAEIALCAAAKRYFDSLGYGKNKKLPAIESLRQEYAALAAESKKLYPQQKRAREKMIELLMAKQNTDMILGEAKRRRREHEIGGR